MVTKQSDKGIEAINSSIRWYTERCLKVPQSLYEQRDRVRHENATRCARSADAGDVREPSNGGG